MWATVPKQTLDTFKPNLAYFPRFELSIANNIPKRDPGVLKSKYAGRCARFEVEWNQK
jgi:hypothetical protein